MLQTGILVFSFLPKPSEEKHNHDGGMILNPPNRRVDNVFAWVSLLLNLFMAGVKLDPTMQWQFGKRKTLIIGSCNLLIPMAAGFAIYCILKEHLELLDESQNKYIVLALYVLSATFPVAVYEILEELGLLNSELGRLALSSTMIQAWFGWPCLVVFTAMRQGHEDTMNGFKALVSFLAIVAFIVLVINPYALRIVRTTPPSGRVRGVHIMVITFVALLMGMLSDMSGSTTYCDGAIMTGLAIPDGPPLGKALIERVDVVASEVLLPLAFMHEGYYIDLMAAKQKLNASLLLGLLVLVIFIARIVANVAAALLHLVEQQGRAGSSLICHRNEKGHISTAQMNHVHNYFLNFEQAKRSAGINVIPFTSVTPLNSMHHDICSLVLEKNISLVIVPYPKKNSIADLEASTATHNLVPLVLENAPCSVGIMVYHGTTRIMEHSYWQYHVCVLFWGGPDDRESIAIASRMARHPGVYLRVIRFLTSRSTTDEKDVAANDDEKKVLDDKMIVELQVANGGNNRLTVTEVSMRDVRQVISMIGAIGDDKYDLLVVGRRQENLSALAVGLTKWTETPELGVLGDLLSTDISGSTNLLIVQQHIVT
ncbi:hypothetical protein LUZ60_016120 [Juncus effusus]|nr:hypothetical protein LUZ60_016120 [Juncus effusus]